MNWRRLIETGGLPSSHSAFVCGLASGVGVADGLGSSTFAIAAVFASVVMYDALSLRREAGKHADVLNELLLISVIKDAFKEREAPQGPPWSHAAGSCRRSRPRHCHRPAI